MTKTKPIASYPPMHHILTADTIRLLIDILRKEVPLLPEAHAQVIRSILIRAEASWCELWIEAQQS